IRAISERNALIKSFGFNRAGGPVLSDAVSMELSLGVAVGFIRCSSLMPECANAQKQLDAMICCERGFKHGIEPAKDERAYNPKLGLARVDVAGEQPSPCAGLQRIADEERADERD